MGFVWTRSTGTGPALLGTCARAHEQDWQALSCGGRATLLCSGSQHCHRRIGPALLVACHARLRRRAAWYAAAGVDTGSGGAVDLGYVPTQHLYARRLRLSYHNTSVFRVMVVAIPVPTAECQCFLRRSLFQVESYSGK